MADGDLELGVSPYASAGGGTVLEHLYGAVLLSSLLTGDPVTELGEDAALVSVLFQGRRVSPVDDLVASGFARDGHRRVSIGVRRDPTLTSRNKKTARLLASYVRMVAEYWDEVTAGHWRLCLAVAVSGPAISQLRELTVIASAAPDEARFRADVALPRRTDRGERSRLVHVDALIASAVEHAGSPADSIGARELAWRVLRYLKVRELRLEGGNYTDRAHAVSRLRQLTPDLTPSAAENLFARIAGLAGRYASTGADVTKEQLRADLGIPLGHLQPTFQAPRDRGRHARRPHSASRPDPAARRRRPAA